MPLPQRQIRAHYDADTITVYQAYPPAIADAALSAGRFVPPFKRDRMTWIKPSFLWMAYRCGWATKPGQERVLAIDITRTGFEWALTHSCLSHHDPAISPDHESWAARLASSPVRVQWDPERDLHHRPLQHRSIQIGLSGPAVRHYIDDWTANLTDVTNTFAAIRDLLTRHDEVSAATLVPTETAYPIDAAIAQSTGASR